MNEKIRTSIQFNLNKPQRELFEMICSRENRSITKQSEFFFKRALMEWYEKNRDELLVYARDKQNNQLKKIAADPTILLK